MQSIKIKTTKNQEILDITSEVKNIVKKSKVKDGLCCVYAKHATAAIIINENYDPGVCDDILATLDKLVPLHSDYKHDTIDNNAHAHIKSTILGSSQVIPVKNNELMLGRWQGIAIVEFDGPRDREILIKIC